MKLDTDIRKFWLWLEKNNALIRRVLEEGSEENRKELTNFFDEKILSLGRLSWEISSGETRKFSLTISPNRDFELLKLTKRIVSIAPELADWEFNYARKVVSSPESFKIYDANLDPIIINPFNWQVELTGNTVLVKSDELKNLDEETREHAMDLVVTAMYGEEYRIRSIQKFIYDL